ncbi:hypothetical protein [Polycyclovorans algicola]|uniref:hypothetical protein n=1 Tax=Polycyclovorans algicola TaxID=616992 RepID=UPI0004A7758D|nr:hypothetical protein [Polycyclovorans algicola]
MKFFLQPLAALTLALATSATFGVDHPYVLTYANQMLQPEPGTQTQRTLTRLKSLIRQSSEQTHWRFVFVGHVPDHCPGQRCAEAVQLRQRVEHIAGQLIDPREPDGRLSWRGQSGMPLELLHTYIEVVNSDATACANPVWIDDPLMPPTWQGRGSRRHLLNWNATAPASPSALLVVGELDGAQALMKTATGETKALAANQPSLLMIRDLPAIVEVEAPTETRALGHLLHDWDGEAAEAGPATCSIRIEAWNP